MQDSRILGLLNRSSILVAGRAGSGQTATPTYAAFVPHNDYLCTLAVYRPFNLIVFASFLLHITNGLTAGATKILFKNLSDNFTSMAIYFAYAGRFTAASRRPVSRDVPKPELIVGGLADSRAG